MRTDMDKSEDVYNLTVTIYRMFTGLIKGFNF